MLLNIIHGEEIERQETKKMAKEIDFAVLQSPQKTRIFKNTRAI